MVCFSSLSLSLLVSCLSRFPVSLPLFLFLSLCLSTLVCSGTGGVLWCWWFVLVLVVCSGACSLWCLFALALVVRSGWLALELVLLWCWFALVLVHSRWFALAGLLWGWLALWLVCSLAGPLWGWFALGLVHSGWSALAGSAS